MPALLLTKRTKTMVGSIDEDEWGEDKPLLEGDTHGNVSAVPKDVDDTWRAVGVELYFEFLRYSAAVLLLAGTPWAVLSVVRWYTYAASRDVSTLVCTRPKWLCVLSAGPADGVTWWMAQGMVSLLSVLILLVSPALLRRHQLRVWGDIERTNHSASQRSILVTSGSLRGLLALVPDSEQVREVFEQRYGAVTNVMMMLDIGLLLRLRRYHTALRDELDRRERMLQRWRPLQGMARLPLCRLFRWLARRSAQRSIERVERRIQRAKVDIEIEESRDAEAVGAVVITFAEQASAQAALAPSSAAMPRSEGFSDYEIELEKEEQLVFDLPSRWWFAPSTAYSVSFGSGCNSVHATVRVSSPPAPDDLAFECFCQASSEQSFLSSPGRGRAYSGRGQRFGEALLSFEHRCASIERRLRACGCWCCGGKRARHRSNNEGLGGTFHGRVSGVSLRGPGTAERGLRLLLCVIWCIALGGSAVGLHLIVRAARGQATATATMPPSLPQRGSDSEYGFPSPILALVCAWCACIVAALKIQLQWDLGIGVLGGASGWPVRFATFTLAQRAAMELAFITQLGVALLALGVGVLLCSTDAINHAALPGATKDEASYGVLPPWWLVAQATTVPICLSLVLPFELWPTCWRSFSALCIRFGVLERLSLRRHSILVRYFPESEGRGALHSNRDNSDLGREHALCPEDSKGENCGKASHSLPRQQQRTFCLGTRYAAHLVPAALACLVRAGPLLFWSVAGAQALSLMSERAELRRNATVGGAVSRPRYGAAVAVRVVHRLPLLGAMHAATGVLESLCLLVTSGSPAPLILAAAGALASFFAVVHMASLEDAAESRQPAGTTERILATADIVRRGNATPMPPLSEDHPTTVEYKDMRGVDDVLASVLSVEEEGNDQQRQGRLTIGSPWQAGLSTRQVLTRRTSVEPWTDGSHCSGEAADGDSYILPIVN